MYYPARMRKKRSHANIVSPMRRENTARHTYHQDYAMPATSAYMQQHNHLDEHGKDWVTDRI